VSGLKAGQPRSCGLLPAWGKGKVVRVHGTKACRGVAPLINLGASWRWAVSFIPRPLCPWGRLQVPTD